MKYTKVECYDDVLIKELSALATYIVKEHYDPILGVTQNDYMIDKYQSVSAITEQLEHGYQYYIVSDDGGYKVGFLGFYPKEEDMYLSKLYLLKNQRGKGFSKEILQFLITKTRESGLSSIVLNVNKYNDNTILAYERLGFVQIREEKNDIGNGYYMDDYVYCYFVTT